MRLTTLLLLLTAGGATAAEIQFRERATVSGAVVRLGDVADVFAASPQEIQLLSAVELCPAPAAGQERSLHARQVQDLLFLRGVSVAEHRLSGASRLLVTVPTEAAAVEAGGPLDDRRAEREVRGAILRHLQAQSDDRGAWTADFALTEEQQRAVLESRRSVRVAGGQAPWTGVQRFDVVVSRIDRAERFPLDVRVGRPTAVVVACRPVSKGATLVRDDLRLEPVAAPVDGCYLSIDEVLGLETARALTEGRPLDRNAVRQPIAVRRGEMVTVWARAEGIRLRTQARARGEGAVGDLVSVEGPEQRTAYQARVCGLREVEVLQPRTPTVAR